MWFLTGIFFGRTLEEWETSLFYRLAPTNEHVMIINLMFKELKKKCTKKMFLCHQGPLFMTELEKISDRINDLENVIFTTNHEQLR
jgi:hypothetical protein